MQPEELPLSPTSGVVPDRAPRVLNVASGATGQPLDLVLRWDPVPVPGEWYDAMLEHGYEGVSEIETRVSNTYGWSATANAVEGWVYQDIAETFLLDEEMRARMGNANPHATADIARRLLEAEARGFWDANDETIEQLREIYGNLEDQMEGVVAA